MAIDDQSTPAAARQIMRGSGYGPVMDILVGIVGALVGGWVMRALGFAGQGGFIYTILVAILGAVLFTWLLRLITGSKDTGSGSSKGTLVVEEWTNPGAITATKKVNALFEKQHPGVKVKLQNAPTANNAWQTLTNSMLAAKSVDVLAQFAPTQAGFPPSYTNLKPSGTSALITSNQLTDLIVTDARSGAVSRARYKEGWRDEIGRVPVQTTAQTEGSGYDAGTRQPYINCRHAACHGFNHRQ